MHITKLLFHPLTALVITIAALLFSFSLYKSTQEIRASQRALDQVEHELEQLSETVTETQALVEKADDPLAKEKIIRNELLMQKPGERVVQVPDSSTDESSNDDPTPSPKPWQEWQVLLFGY